MKKRHVWTVYSVRGRDMCSVGRWEQWDSCDLLILTLGYIFTEGNVKLNWLDHLVCYFHILSIYSFFFCVSKCTELKSLTLNALLWTFRSKTRLLRQLSFSPRFLWRLSGPWRCTWLFIQHPAFCFWARHPFWGDLPFPHCRQWF